MKNKKSHTVFTSFLEALEVKHTDDFSNGYFNEHPHKYNLFGISKMLSDYGIENAGTRIADKEQDLFNIECPFIAHIGSDFVVVYKIEPDKVHYLWNGKKISLSVSEFVKTWTGVVLLAETTTRSIEPDYGSRIWEARGMERKNAVAGNAYSFGKWVQVAGHL